MSIVVNVVIVVVYALLFLPNCPTFSSSLRSISLYILPLSSSTSSMVPRWINGGIFKLCHVFYYCFLHSRCFCMKQRWLLTMLDDRAMYIYVYVWRSKMQASAFLLTKSCHVCTLTGENTVKNWSDDLDIYILCD